MNYSEWKPFLTRQGLQMGALDPSHRVLGGAPILLGGRQEMLVPLLHRRNLHVARGVILIPLNRGIHAAK